MSKNFITSTICFLLSFSHFSSSFKRDHLTKYHQSIFLSSSNSFFPIYSNFPFNASSPHIPSLTNITILIHGLDRNADRYFEQGMNLTEGQILIVPLFSNSSLSLSDWTQQHDSSIEDSPFWTKSTWMDGGMDDNYGVSSFELMDDIIELLQSKKVQGKIVIAGFSAGAQFVQRYAWASDLGTDKSVRFFVSDPSSFLYFSDERPGEECRPLNSSSVENCQSFQLTHKLSVDSKLTECLKYNYYKYGLDEIDENNDYLVTAAQRSALSTYSSKEIFYVFGGNDVCNCQSEGYQNDENICFPFSISQCLDSYPDAKENALETKCQAMIQGSNRLQRGLNFIAYLKFLWGDDYEANFSIVPGMGHDSAKFFTSELFQTFGVSRKEIGGTENLININD